MVGGIIFSRHERQGLVGVILFDITRMGRFVGVCLVDGSQHVAVHCTSFFIVVFVRPQPSDGFGQI